MKRRQRYVDTRLAFWKAVEMGDMEQREATEKIIDTIAAELKRAKEKEDTK
jgi:hypothetical protein